MKTRYRLHLLVFLAAAIARAAEAPADDAYHANWPRFRGPEGGGVYTPGKPPITCDLAAGKNVRWKTPVPSPGFGSPVIWGGRVFLSGGDAASRRVMCFDLPSGQLLWNNPVPKAADDPGLTKAPDDCGMAAATVAADGGRVYAVFATGELAAFNFDGALAWSNYLKMPRNQYGHATSLLTWKDRLIVQFDQGDADEGLSKLHAFDGATGAVIWEQPRPAGASWSTPIAIEAAGRSQIITLAAPWVISYAPRDGAELWRANLLDGEVTPSPIFAGGKLLIVSPTIKMQALKPDGNGDVTDTHPGWIAEDGIPDVSSPVSDGELAFVIDSGGTLSCYDAGDGKKQWQHEFGEEFTASPSIAGGKLYLLGRKGALIAVQVGREFKELGRSELGEPVYASPAFVQNKLVIRGLKHLICLEAKNGEPANP